MANSGSIAGDLKMDRFSCVWTIIDFEKLPQKNGEFLKSPTFSAGEYLISEWYMKLFPRGDKEYADKLGLFLYFDWKVADHCVAKFNVAVLKPNDEKYNLKSSKVITFGKDGWGYPDFISRDFILNETNEILDKNKNLKIFCQVFEIIRPEVPTPKCTLIEDLENLLKNANLSDVSLDVVGQKFPAHKAILASRSSVFHGMFKSPMKEIESNSVEITDLDPDVLKEMLTFIYSGKSPNLDKMASDLLAAADKYDLEILKEMCEAKLCRNICIETAAESLILADLYRLDTLKTTTLNFINNNKFDVTKTQGWQDIEKRHVHLVVELYNTLANDNNGQIKNKS